MKTVSKNLYSKTFIRRFGDLLSLVSGTNPETQNSLELLVKGYTAYISSLCKHEGQKRAVNLLKEIHTIAVKIAMGRPFDPLPFQKSDKRGVPRVIKPMEHLLNGEPKEKRVALSITKLYLRLILEPEVDFSVIEKPTPSFTLGRRWSKFLNLWSRKFKTPNLAWDSKYHATTKKGPNGHALLSCHEDLEALSNSPEVFNNLKTWVSLSDTSLLKRIEHFQAKWSKEVTGQFTHSRLFLIAEGGGKTRPVAISDYFTQESMKALFRASMKALRKLETDGTYDQGQIVDKTRQAIRDNKPIYCLDLSNATDRFPVSLQVDFLERWIGIDRAQAWGKLLTKRKFSIGIRDVEYRAGQPMGILSSWSVFALTHHAIIEYAGSLEGYKSFRDYVVLGDDVAIFNSRVAKRYKSIMKLIGVTISPVKSFEWIPGSSPFPPSGEIAKRLLYKEEEITPIPYHLAYTWSKTPRRETLALRLGLEDIGLELPYAAWETLCRRVTGKSHYLETLVIATCPSDLIGRKHGLHPPFKGVIQGPWKEIDLNQAPRILAELLIEELKRKRLKFEEVMRDLMSEDFYNRFKLQGKPISLSVLGMDSEEEIDYHPLPSVIMRKYMELVQADDILANAILEEREADLSWESVYSADFNINETYVSEIRKRSWTQTSILFKLYKLLLLEKPGQLDKLTQDHS